MFPPEVYLAQDDHRIVDDNCVTFRGTSADNDLLFMYGRVAVF